MAREMLRSDRRGVIRRRVEWIKFSDPYDRHRQSDIISDARGLELVGLSLIHISEPTRPY